MREHDAVFDSLRPKPPIRAAADITAVGSHPHIMSPLEKHTFWPLLQPGSLASDFFMDLLGKPGSANPGVSPLILIGPGEGSSLLEAAGGASVDYTKPLDPKALQNMLTDMFKPQLEKTGVKTLNWAPDAAEMTPGKAEELAGFDKWLENVEKPTVEDFTDILHRAYPVDWKHPARSTPDNPLITEAEPYMNVVDAQADLRHMKQGERYMNNKIRGEIMGEAAYPDRLKMVKKANALDFLKGLSKQ